MTLREQLLHNPAFTFRHNVFYQQQLSQSLTFEKDYLAVRNKEYRVYPDEVVKHLPHISKDHPLQQEWQKRKATLKKILQLLSKKENHLILEIGCGNGWLSNAIASSVCCEICAMDINKTELLQGASVFSERKNISFLYVDIFTASFTNPMFDTILLAASIQYFTNLNLLIKRLLELIHPGGEILIADTPFYSSAQEAANAKQRSNNYFTETGIPEMKDQYFHHTFEDLAAFRFEILYDPRSLPSRFKKKILGKILPVFPILRITNNVH